MAPALLALGASSFAQNPVGQLLGPDASVKGSVTLTAAGPGIVSGSTVSAGHENATIRLSRGGEVRLCRGSAMSLTSSANGTEIMMGLSSGTMEAHYALTNSNDSIMTPDFQIQLLGPGTFNVAISADERGNTCVQSLPSNSGSVRVSELMGDGVYELKPSEQVFFRGGKVSSVLAAVGSCGCGVMPAVMQASAAPPPTNPQAKLLSTTPSPLPLSPAPPPANVATAVMVDTPKDVHVEVDAPFVFRATDTRPVPDAPFNMARLYISGLPTLPAADITAPAPPNGVRQQAMADDRAKKKRKGFWGRIASIFRG
ncbi:MAG: hypothetical protein JO187_13765 [Acidobacteria bacterium]|nr:hypothetical protein [Acidobacteriota bacterium]